jgi:GNAT superfamily N-acetyltransferase
MKGEILVSKERDKKRIRSLLETDRLWAGYALCDLEQEFFRLCDWYVACMNDAVVSLCLYYKGLQPPTQITMGDPYGIEKILSSADVLGELYAHIPLQHREVLERYYAFGELQLMKRMAVTIDTFTPVAGKATRLDEEDLRDLETLYALHSRAFFRPYMLTSGVYCGVKRHGILVSAAGTHVRSHAYSMACLGNVFTHPAHRGKGYATICTSKVVGELLAHHQDVILNVGSQNTPAIAIYEKLGFHEHCTYLEGLGTLV